MRTRQRSHSLPKHSPYFLSPSEVRIGVVGAGTMGSGIALTALHAGLPVILFDISPGILTQAHEYIEKHLNRKGKTSNLKYLVQTSKLDDLSNCNVVIEAIPEELSLKLDIFTRLDTICIPPAILATNTSTLSVTAIAAGTETPERVAGMHFFNPAFVLPLVEVIKGARTHPQVIQSLLSLAEFLGKTPVVASDTPGFIVNRVARPFYGEALRLLGERVASHEQLDRIVRDGGGFRMGPFELMDLIGLDINFSATQSIYEQTFHEPRYRPHQIQARMVAQKALGRKTGHGFYNYSEDNPIKEEPVSSLDPPGGDLVIFKSGTWAPGVEELCQQRGFSICTESSDSEKIKEYEPLVIILTNGRLEGLRAHLADLEKTVPQQTPLLCQSVDTNVAEIASWMRFPERLVGFDGLFFCSSATENPVVTLVNSSDLSPEASQTVETFINHLGFSPIWVSDSPGMILPRIISMLANEAAFAVSEEVADSETIDLAMQLGMNFPVGPLTWAKKIGYAKTVIILDHLHAEYGEERYRTAPLLRKWARNENMHVMK